MDEPGTSLHHEVNALVAADLMPIQPLHSAPGGAAGIMGRRDLGFVKRGALADLIVVDGGSTTDISAVREVAALMLAGRWW